MQEVAANNTISMSSTSKILNNSLPSATSLKTTSITKMAMIAVFVDWIPNKTPGEMPLHIRQKRML